MGGNDKKVIVVLPDAHTRMTVQSTLERAGFTVEAIASGEEALAACREARPDAVVVGSRLTKMDGFVFLYRLKGDGLDRCVPTLMVAEPSEKSREKLALARGARAFLLKPVQVRTLLEKVGQATQGSSSRLDQLHAKQVAKLREREARERASAKPEEAPKEQGPIRVPHKLVEHVQHKRADLVHPARGHKSALIDKLREEVRRLKRLPYHKRLGLELDPDPDDVSSAFRRIAMAYHPDRYKHHGNDVRRLAQGVYVLLSDAKKALRPSAEPSKTDPPPRPSDSWRDLPPREDFPRRDNSWTPASIDLSDLRPPHDSSYPEAPAVRERSTSDRPPARGVGASEPPPDSGRAPDSEKAPLDDRESGERVAASPAAATDKRALALRALAEGRYRDAKNQIGKLLESLGDEREDRELVLAEKLARGHLLWDEGSLDEAIEVLETAFQLEPECAEAIEAIAAIHKEREAKGRGLLGRLLGK